MSDNVIDSLQIEIESSSKTAATSLSKMQTALKKLDALGNGTGIKNLYKSLKSLEKINLSKLANQLTKIFNAAKKPLEIKTKITTVGNAPKAKTVADTSGGIDTTDITRTADAVASATDKINSVAATAAKSFDYLQDPIERVKAEIENYSERIKLLTNDYNSLNASGKGDPLSLLSLEKQIISASGTLDNLKSKFDSLTAPPTPEIIKLGQELLKVESAAEKAASGGNKVLASFKRIAVYRIIRTILREISQAFIEGMKDYVQYSREADKTISNLVNTSNQLKNTLGVTFVSLMSAIEPLIVSLADGVIDIANSINALLAAMNGQDTFSKATKGADSYANSLKKVNAQLYSFDKFETLSKGSDGSSNTSSMFEEVNIEEQLGGGVVNVDKIKKAFEGLGAVILSLGNLVNTILSPILVITGSLAGAFSTLIRAITPAISGIVNFISWIIEGLDKIGALIPLLSALGITLFSLKFLQVRDQAAQFNIAIDEQKLQARLAKMELDSLKLSTNGKATADVKAAQMAYNHEKAMLKQMQTTRVLNTAMAALQAVMGATALGATIGDLIANWSELSTAQKISQISTIILTGAMTALAIANVAAQSGLGAVVAVPLAVLTIGAGIAAAVAAATSAAKVSAYAEGGYPQRGELFIANEAGAELVGNIGGRTAVASNDMIVNAIRQAAYEGIVAGLGQVDFGGNYGEAIFNLDGRTFARAIQPHLKAEQNRSGGR